MPEKSDKETTGIEPNGSDRKIEILLDKDLEDETQPIESQDEVKDIVQPPSPSKKGESLVNKPSPPSSRSKKKIGTITSSSRKKVQDFLNVHRSRQASSKKTSKSKLNESPTSTGTEKKSGGTCCKESSSSNDKKQSGKNSNVSKKNLSKSSKRVRATRNQVSVEKPITVHPMPELDDQERAHMDQIQLGASHVIVKNNFDPKELQKRMRRQNQWYRLVSIIVAFIAITITFVFLGLAAYGAQNVVDLYFILLNERIDHEFRENQWETKFFTEEKHGYMNRVGNFTTEWTKCLIPKDIVIRSGKPTSKEYSGWSNCNNNMKYRYYKIKDDKKYYFKDFLSFAQIMSC